MQPHRAGWSRLRAATVAAALALAPAAVRAACPPLPAPYAGPVFDAAVQAWTSNVDGLTDAMATAGVRAVALFANARAGATSPVAQSVAAFARAHPGSVVAGAPKIGFIRGGDLPHDYVDDVLDGVHAGRYRFVGEVLYTHGDKPDHPPTKTGDVYVDPNAGGTKRLLTGLAGTNVPLLTHWEVWAWDRDARAFGALYAAWPQQRFVLPSLAYGSAAQAETLLSAHPNLWATISRLVDGRYTFVDPAKTAKLGSPMSDACGVLTPAWRAVLVAHADRLLYASDDYVHEGQTWDHYPDVIDAYRRIAGQVPPDVAERISWSNAAALYGFAAAPAR